MTTDEAKNKWCPYAASRSVPFYRSMQRWFSVMTKDGENPNTDCIACQCACWVWDSGEVFQEQHDKSEWQGHCGLAR